MGKGLKIVMNSLKMCHRPTKEIESMGFCLKFEILQLGQEYLAKSITLRHCHFVLSF